MCYEVKTKCDVEHSSTAPGTARWTTPGEAVVCGQAAFFDFYCAELEWQSKAFQSVSSISCLGSLRASLLCPTGKQTHPANMP